MEVCDYPRTSASLKPERQVPIGTGHWLGLRQSGYDEEEKNL
jgi:hypothetical protein